MSNNIYKISVKCTKSTYGYPQSKKEFEVSGAYFKARINWYGNQGFDVPVIINSANKCNGYFLSINSFMYNLYGSNNEIKNELRTMKEKDEIVLEIDTLKNKNTKLTQKDGTRSTDYGR